MAKRTRRNVEGRKRTEGEREKTRSVGEKMTTTATATAMSAGGGAIGIIEMMATDTENMVTVTGTIVSAMSAGGETVAATLRLIMTDERGRRMRTDTMVAKDAMTVELVILARGSHSGETTVTASTDGVQMSAMFAIPTTKRRPMAIHPARLARRPLTAMDEVPRYTRRTPIVTILHTHLRPRDQLDLAHHRRPLDDIVHLLRLPRPVALDLPVPTNDRLQQP